MASFKPSKSDIKNILEESREYVLSELSKDPSYFSTILYKHITPSELGYSKFLDVDSDLTDDVKRKGGLKLRDKYYILESQKITPFATVLKKPPVLVNDITSAEVCGYYLEDKMVWLQSDTFTNEFLCGYILNNFDIDCVQKIALAFVEDNIGFILKERVDYTADDYLKTNPYKIGDFILQVVLCLVALKNNVDFKHNNLTLDNIGVNIKDTKISVNNKIYEFPFQIKIKDLKYCNLTFKGKNKGIIRLYTSNLNSTRYFSYNKVAFPVDITLNTYNGKNVWYKLPNEALLCIRYSSLSLFNIDVYSIILSSLVYINKDVRLLEKLLRILFKQEFGGLYIMRSMYNQDDFTGVVESLNNVWLNCEILPLMLGVLL